MALSIIMPKALDNKPYRLRARFKIEPYPSKGRLERERVRVAEMFVEDLHKQGWENLPRYGFQMKGPFPFVAPTDIHIVPMPTAREMAPLVSQGHRFRDAGGTTAMLVPKLNMTEWWEFEIAGVFARPQIMTEVPDSHEEKKG